MFERITELNQSENASLAQGHVICTDLIDAGLSSNPRLYANTIGGPVGEMIPETGTQDNNGLPGWANVLGGNLVDGTFTDPPTPVPNDVPIYLYVWVQESGGGQGNFCLVATVARYVGQGLLTLAQAVQIG